MSKTYRIVKIGSTPGCPIYQIDERCFLYWSSGALEFAPDYRCATIKQAVKKIRSKHPNAKIYYQIPKEDYL